MAATASKLIFEPQPGPQTVFASTPADIAIYGGAAGGGKSWSLLFEPLRHVRNPRFGATIFRRVTKSIKAVGGLWDESQELYYYAGGAPFVGNLEWRFPGGARITMAHLEHEWTTQDYFSSQIPLIVFDQLEEFTKKQFWYMQSRNRSTCGVVPYMRAGCNPDPDSFVRELIDPWIGEDGYAIKKKSGQVLWLLKDDEELNFFETRDALLDAYTEEEAEAAVTITFVPSRLEDNKILLEKDPGYRAKLMRMDRVTRKRLLEGNWNIRASAGEYFKRGYFPIEDAAPANISWIRHWDLASTEKKTKGDDPDWTAGVKFGRTPEGRFYIGHVERMRASSHKVEAAIRSFAQQDGKGCRVSIPQDPGAAGKAYAQYLARMLAGFDVHVEPESGDKVSRASALSAQAEAGNVSLIRGPWNEAFLNEAENFPEGSHDDQIDAAANAFNLLVRGQGTIRSYQFRM